MNRNVTGKQIQRLRKIKGFSQKELAYKLGVSDKAVSKWETGAGLPEVSLLVPLARLLGTTVDDLLEPKTMSDNTVKDIKPAKTMNYILSKLSVDSRQINGSDVLNDYAYPCNTDFRSDRVVIANDYNVEMPSNHTIRAVIPYDDILRASLSVVRRMKADRVSFLNFTYMFEWKLETAEHETWLIECACFYGIKEVLDRLRENVLVTDITDAFTIFDTPEKFYDLQEDETYVQNYYGGVTRRGSNRKDFIAYCAAHYTEWIKKYGFEKIRMKWPEAI